MPRPVARAGAAWQRFGLFKVGRLADMLTLSRFLLGFVVFGLLVRHQVMVAMQVYVLGAVTDVLDGWVARTWGCPSRQGRLLDAVADRGFILLTVAGLFIAGPMPFPAGLVVGLWLGGELVLGLATMRLTGTFYLYLEHRRSIRLTACCSYLAIGVLIVARDWLSLFSVGIVVLLTLTGLDYAVCLWLNAAGKAHARGCRNLTGTGAL